MALIKISALPTLNTITDATILPSVESGVTKKVSAQNLKQFVIDSIPKPITNFTLKTADYTALNNDLIIANTNTGTFTITLPASPDNGSIITIVDGDNWATNNLIIARNGTTINGVADDLLVNIGQIQLELVFDGTTWKFYFSSAATVLATTNGSARTSTNVLDYGVFGDGVADDTAAIQILINNNSLLYFPAGTYNISSLNLKGKNVILYGDGIDKTIFKSISTVPVFIDVYETTDVRISPFQIHNMTIDSNHLASTGMNCRYRHGVNVENVRFTNAISTNLTLKDSWLSLYRNCFFDSATYGVWLEGSDHRTKFDCCSFQGNSEWQIIAQRGGTEPDGNHVLEFSNCDIEFATGGGCYLDVSSATFNTCYIGENLEGRIFKVINGNIQLFGGFMLYGYTQNSIGFEINGGSVEVKGTSISTQNYGTFPYLASGTATNALRLYDVDGGGAMGGDQVMSGNLIGHGPQGTVFAERFGKSWVGQGNNVGFSSAISVNAQTFTATSAPGPNPLLGARSMLFDQGKWMDNDNAYIIIVYESSQITELKLSGGAFGSLPTTNMGYLPATTGQKQTYIKFDKVLNASSYVILELVQLTSDIGDFITVHECYFADARMLAKGTSSFGNLYKC